MAIISNDYDRRYIIAQTDAASSSAIFTPPESIAGEAAPPTPSVPLPGNLYIIKFPTTSHVLTLTGGHVILAPENSTYPDGSALWRCTDTDGWLGFQNPISGRFLGRDNGNTMVCSAERAQKWEYFAVLPKEGGAFVLKQEHLHGLRHVGRAEVNGMEKLRKMVNGEGPAEVVEFYRVETESSH